MTIAVPLRSGGAVAGTLTALSSAFSIRRHRHRLPVQRQIPISGVAGRPSRVEGGQVGLVAAAPFCS